MAETVEEAARRVAMMTNVVPMAPVNPGAFSGVPQGGAISNQEAAMMAAQRGMQQSAPMPNVPCHKQTCQPQLSIQQIKTA